MRFLVFLIFIILPTNVLCGGDSKCSKLENSFNELLQAFEDIIYEVLNLVIETVTSHPFTGNSYIEMYFCCLNALTNLLAKGTNQLTGVDTSYILGILNGINNSPFPSPLDCIESELLSFYSLTYSISVDDIPSLERLIQKSPINESTSCPIVKEIFASYYLLFDQLQQKGIDIGINGGIAFANIGHSDLFLEYIGLSVPCVIDATTNGIANALNMNSSIVSAYFTNQSISVPHPLSCVKGLVDSAISTINSGYENINNTIVSPSPPPNCDTLYSEFKAFATIWYKQVFKIRSYATSQSTIYPILTSYFIAEALCDLNSMTIFVANVTSYLSGANSDLVYEILVGSVSPPYAPPLNCIENDLILMRNELSTLMNDVIPKLEIFAINATDDTSSCNATYQALAGSIRNLVAILNEKGSLMSDITAAFAAINMTDIFLASYASTLECLAKLVGKYVGAVLNVNGSSVTAYIDCNNSSLSDPFDCVKLVIDIISSLINQALINFATGSSNILVAPNISNYFE